MKMEINECCKDCKLFEKFGKKCWSWWAGKKECSNVRYGYSMSKFEKIIEREIEVKKNGKI